MASTSIVPTVLIMEHFNKYRATALGLVSGSVDISGMLTPSLVQFFLDKYGFSGCLLLLGGLSLNLFIACIFMKRPPKEDDSSITGVLDTIAGSQLPDCDTHGETSKSLSARAGITGNNKGERGDVKQDRKDSPAPTKHKSIGDVRLWIRNTVSLAMVHGKRSSKSGDSPGKMPRDVRRAKVIKEDELRSHVSSVELYAKRLVSNHNAGDLKSEGREGNGEISYAAANLSNRRTGTKIAQGMKEKNSSRTSDNEVRSIAPGGFLEKLRSVSNPYIWTVCTSKGAANFSSYTFGLVLVDYAHDVGVLGQRAALLPALFSSGCLVATLMTGPAVDRKWITRYAFLMSCPVCERRILLGVAARSL